jgi:hypothetical protein
MRFDGTWVLCADGVERPAIFIDLLLPGGQLAQIPFLLDTGADATVVAYDVAQQLAAYTSLTPNAAPATGIGGAAATEILAVDLLFTTVDGRRSLIRGPLLAFASSSTSDLSILGRDVIDLFDLVYSRRNDQIALLTPPDSVVLA